MMKELEKNNSITSGGVLSYLLVRKASHTGDVDYLFKI